MRETRLGLAACAAIQLFWAFTRPLQIFDEPWFLQAARRVLDGETMYRDVYFNTTPLSLALGTLAIGVSGVRLLTIRLLVSASVLASLWIAAKLVERAAPGRSPLLLFAFVLAYRIYPAETPYTPLAVTFFLLTMYGYQRWSETERDSVAFWSGVAAGLCLATKHNIGLAVFAALVLAMRRMRPVAAAAAGFALIGAVTAGMIALGGGLDAFLEYGFRNKGTYVALGSASYLDHLRQLAADLSSPRSITGLGQILFGSALLLPIVTGVLVLRSRNVSLAIFLAAACASTYPRAGVSFSYVVPILGAIATIAWRKGGEPRTRALRVGAAGSATAWLAFALVALVALPISRLASPQFRFSHIEPLRGILVSSAEEDRLMRTSAALRAAVTGKDAFFLTMAAGFFHLTTGIGNPTPYDMPAATTFGPHGQQQVIAWIRSGRVREVVVFPPDRPWQVPHELTAAIPALMRERARGDAWTLYTLAP